MSMTANKVLDRVEALGMLDPKVIGELRRQVAESKFHVSAEAIVKLLVDKKHLTSFQAKKLVAEVTSEPEPAAAVREPAGTAKSSSAKSSSKAPADDEDDLLANFGGPPAAPPPKPAEEEEIVDLEAALPPAKPLRAEVKPLQPAGPKPTGKPAMPPGLTPIKPAPTSRPPSLTPVDRAAPPPPTPGLTPLHQPAAAPGLSPISSAPAAPSAPPPAFAPLGGAGDPLMGDALGGFGGGALGPPPPPPEKAAGVKKRLARGWDSPWLLIGGAGVGVMLIAFVVLYFALTRGSAQDLLAEANDAYSQGQYSTAIALYEKFVSKYPEEPGVSSAKVKTRAARIHLSYDGAKDMTRALEAVQRELPEMEKEESFDEIRSELESILPAIADNFASSARTATNLKRMEAQVALAHSAMKLVNNASYLPTDRRTRQQARIDEIMEKIRVAERTINQGKALADATAAMQAKLTDGDIKAAYDERARLLQNYPTLQNHATVVKHTLAISQRERDLVTTTPQTQAAANDDPHLPTHRRLMLARHSGGPIGAPDDSAAFMLIRGTVYAIDVASGKVRWRRHVGGQTQIQPLPVSGGDVIVSDEAHREVLRLAGASGQVVWRQSFGESFAAPQALGDSLYVTLASGRVVRLNAASGELDRAAQLPQAAQVAAGTDARGKILYQPAEHSTLYALLADDTDGEPLSCRSAFYLGHPPGSIAVPPMVVVGYVFVFQNEGAASSLVHALSVAKDGSLSPARDPIRLRGRVTVPPISLRSRLIVVTDLGETLVADVDPGNEASPVNVTAQKPGGLSQPTIGYPAVSGSRLFVGDLSLAEFEIVATRQALEPRSSNFAGDAFVAPLQIFGNTLVHARQRSGAASVTVTGVNLSDNQSWQVALAAPIVGVNAYPEQKQFAAVSSDGDLFEVGVDAFQEGVRDQPASSTGGVAAQAYRDVVPLPEGKSLLRERSGKLWAIQEAQSGGAIQRVQLQAQGGTLAARPASLGGGILAPLSQGGVWLLDAASGAPLGGTTPFQPETMPGAKIRWLPPLVVDERQFVAIDAARKTIYLARREEKPSPFLAQTRLLEVDYEPAYAALLDTSLLVVARGASEDEIVSLSLPALQEAKRLKVAGRVGPRGLEVVGGHAYCQTGTGQLLKITPSLELAAQAELGEVTLAGPPLAFGSDLLLVAQSGQVLRLSGASGEVQPLASAGEPLTGAVQMLGSSLLAGGANGTLHFLPLAAAEKETQP